MPLFNLKKTIHLHVSNNIKIINTKTCLKTKDKRLLK